MRKTAFQVSFCVAVAGLALGSASPALSQTLDSFLVGTCKEGESEAYLDVGNVRARTPNAGEYVVRYHPEDLPSGVFLARLQLDRSSTTQKFVHIK
ncbi:MAG: hypothetical protein IH951_12915 [Bacteroidetes bacterium]|nr:hypothetical protein [Bacteroidota bacterium]